MKNVLYIGLLLVFPVVHAQNSIEGQWLLEAVTIDGKTIKPFFIIDFKKDGSMMVYGIKAGTWKYNEAKKELVMRSEMDKDFNGASKVLKLTEDSMTLKKDQATLFYQRLNPATYVVQNMQSGLSSSWVLKTDTDNVELIQFQEPDIYSYSNNQAGFSESSKGIWIYKGGSELLILCLKHQFSGLNKIVKITDSELILKNNQTEYTFLKQKVNPKPIAHLSFSYEHFQGEDENNMLDNWRYSPAMIEAIGIHKSLIYSRKTLLKDGVTFKTSTLVKKIKVDSNSEWASIRNLGVIKQDTTQYSESYVGHMINTDNLFYPEVALDVYRVIGNEQLKVNAGTFDCNVIEGMRDEVKIKMWMIMDKPGVYAKIIEEGKNVFGDNEYIVTELEALNLKNDRP